MKLIIDIPKELFEEIKCDEACGLNELTRAIANGKLLTREYEELASELDNIGVCENLVPMEDVFDILNKHIKENKQ